MRALDLWESQLLAHIIALVRLEESEQSRGSRVRVSVFGSLRADNGRISVSAAHALHVQDRVLMVTLKETVQNARRSVVPGLRLPSLTQSAAPCHTATIRLNCVRHFNCNLLDSGQAEMVCMHFQVL